MAKKCRSRSPLPCGEFREQAAHAGGGSARPSRIFRRRALVQPFPANFPARQEHVASAWGFPLPRGGPTSTCAKKASTPFPVRPFSSFSGTAPALFHERKKDEKDAPVLFRERFSRKIRMRKSKPRCGDFSNFAFPARFRDETFPPQGRKAFLFSMRREAYPLPAPEKEADLHERKKGFFPVFLPDGEKNAFFPRARLSMDAVLAPGGENTYTSVFRDQHPWSFLL